MSEHREIERKYAVDAATRMPDLGARSRSEAPVDLEAVYFDTADWALLRARIALRRRTGGHDAGWHLKVPAGPGRLEVHEPIDGDDDAVPRPLRDRVASAVGDAPLVPVARVSTRRTAIVVPDDGGADRVEVVDDLVVARDLTTGEERRWREWEAEQLGDDESAAEAVLDAIESVLIGAGATRSPSPAKLAAALGGEAGIRAKLGA